jgi:transcription initiation factor TFIIE subunit beta
MALSEQLNKFKLQQERCQITPSSIAAYQSSASKPKVTPGFQPINASFAPVKALQPIKFSDDMDMLQRINSVRKSHPGLQIKLVIELLYKVNAKDPT